MRRTVVPRGHFLRGSPAGGAQVRVDPACDQPGPGTPCEQDDKTVTLKSENDKREVIQREDISKMTDQKKSMMPEGLPDTLKPQEFRDLVKFLQGDGW